MRVPVALLATLLASGCVAPLAAPETAGTTTLPWGLSRCAFVIVDVPVDEAKLATLLPPGFKVAPSQLAPLPDGPRATLAFDAYRCAEGVGADGNLTDVSYGSHYVAVVPPGLLREANVTAYFVKLDPVLADAPIRTALAAAGMRVHSGNASVQIAGAAVTVGLAFDDGGGFGFTGAAGAPQPQGNPLPFIEYTPLREGPLARWHARLHDASLAQGTGTIEIHTAWAKALVGSDRAPATFVAGAWNLDEGDVTWPVAWP